MLPLCRPHPEGPGRSRASRATAGPPGSALWSFLPPPEPRAGPEPPQTRNPAPISGPHTAGGWLGRGCPGEGVVEGGLRLPHLAIRVVGWSQAGGGEPSQRGQTCGHRLLSAQLDVASCF